MKRYGILAQGQWLGWCSCEAHCACMANLLKGPTKRLFLSSLPLLTSPLLQVNLTGGPHPCDHITYVKWEFDPLEPNFIQSCSHTHPQKIRQKGEKERERKRGPRHHTK